MKKFLLFSVGLLIVLFMFNCSEGNGNSGEEPTPTNNPIPALTTITPNSKVSHMPDFILTATGSDFVSEAKIVFNGTEMTTNFVSSTELTCEIGPDDTVLASAQAGAYDGEVSGILTTNVLILVRNPSPGGGDSSSLDFTVRHNHQFTDGVDLSFDLPQIRNLSMAMASDGTINVCMQRYISFTEEMIYMKRSTDGGDNWGSGLPVTQDATDSPYNPVLALAGNGDLDCLYCRYTDGKVYFQRSSNNGQTWSTPVRLYDPTYPLYINASDGDIVVDGSGNISVVFQQQESQMWAGNVYFTRSATKGTSWETPKLLSVPNYAINPAIAVDGNNNLFVVWQKRTTDTAQTTWFTHLRRSSNGGASWTTGININPGEDGYYQGGPEVAVDMTNNYIYVVWAMSDEYYYGYEVFFSRSTNSGSTWSSPVNITANGLTNTDPDIAVDSAGNINVVWTHSGDVYLRRSIDQGNSWNSTVQVCKTSAVSSEPTIGVDGGGNIKVAWREKATVMGSTYFSRSTY